MRKFFRIAGARFRLWWYFRDKHCYICVRDDHVITNGQEDLQDGDNQCYPCHKHALQASKEMRQASGRVQVRSK